MNNYSQLSPEKFFALTLLKIKDKSIHSWAKKNKNAFIKVAEKRGENITPEKMAEYITTYAHLSSKPKN